MTRPEGVAPRDTDSALSLRGPFVTLVVALLLAVGMSAWSGWVGISRLDRTLHEVVFSEVKCLLHTTHVRRLFRSELLILHRLSTTTSQAERDALELERGALRRERADRLLALQRLHHQQQGTELATLQAQDQLGDGLLHQSSQPWEPAVAVLLQQSEQRLAQLTVRSTADTATAERWLLFGSGSSILCALILGFVVLRRVRLASLALASEKEKFRLVVESAPSLLCMLSSDGSLLYVPPQGSRFRGVDGSCLLADPLCWVSGEERAKLAAAIEEVGRTSVGTSATRLVAVRKDGTNWFASAVLTPLVGATSGSSGIIVQILDVTGEVRAEQAKTVLEEQLRQSQKMESIGRLAGGIAHDFNNLLTAIKGFASLLREDLAPTGSALNDLEGITEAADRAATLTQQLLAFSRKQVLIPRVTDIGSVVRQMEKILNRIIGEDISIKVCVANDLGLCLVDTTQVEQILLNLVVNARQAMPEGGAILIEVCNTELDESYVLLHPEASPGPHIQLAVSDTGVGMSKELQERVFEPFFTTKPAGQGTGLGLSVVHGAVQQQGGSISLCSEPGLGTTFRIYLPRVTNEQHTSEKPGVDPTSLTGTESILLVEDDPLVREFSRRALTQRGYQVCAVDSAEHAQTLVDENGPRFVMLVTDVVLPGASGPTLAEHLLLRQPDLRVLFCSGYSEQLLTRTGRLSPGKNLLQKPYDTTGLLLQVRRVLDERPDPVL